MGNFPIKETLDLTEAEINSLIKTRQDFIDGKTTARDWQEIEKDLDQMFGPVNKSL